MTARPRKNTESPEEYRRALLQQVFTSGETHAEHKEESHAKHNEEHYHIDGHDSLIKAILEVNGSLFCHYMIDQGLDVNDFEHQKMFAKIYTDMIHSMLIDFIECNERGELG